MMKKLLDKCETNLDLYKLMKRGWDENGNLSMSQDEIERQYTNFQHRFNYFKDLIKSDFPNLTQQEILYFFKNLPKMKDLIDVFSEYDDMFFMLDFEICKQQTK